MVQIEVLTLKILRFAIEKWHFECYPVRGIDICQNVLHKITIQIAIVWNGELWWVMVFLALENW